MEAAIGFFTELGVALEGHRLCYVRGPEGILVGLAQELGGQAS